MLRLLTVAAGIARAGGWVAVTAALAVLAAEMACGLASAPRVLPASANGAAPPTASHSADAHTGGGGQSQSAGVEIDPTLPGPSPPTTAGWPTWCSRPSWPR